MDKSDVSAICFILTLILALAMPIHATVFTWPPKTYEANKAIAELRKAEAVNDLDLVAKYTENAIKNLETYTGNPCWWYPTVNTDWGRIKENLRSIVDSAKTLEANPSTFAYQQMLHNLEDELLELREQINDAINWMTMSSIETLVYLLVWISLAVITIILL